MYNKYLDNHEWQIIESQWNPDKHEGSESIFSIGNGYMGQRANFEENYSGPHLQGSYIGGVYYPDKTRVGWWKNGYPEYFAKVLNSVNWIGLKIQVDGIDLDLFKCEVSGFKRVLDMKNGLLQREFIAKINPELELKISTTRLISMKRKEIGALQYSITPVNCNPKLKISPYLDFDIVNSDSNYDEKFWDSVSENVGSQKAVLQAKTKKLDFQVAAAIRYELFVNDEHFTIYPLSSKKEKYAENSFEIQAKSDSTYCLNKYAAIVSTLNSKKENLITLADSLASDAMRDGFDQLVREQREEWAEKWSNCDIKIEGDLEAQQAIRFNIFQLTQTYTGADSRLNIGPKGFTGEKYGGSTYWDTEAYCLPFYMASAGQEVAKNLLVYRYKHLPKAIENAEKLGFTNGAALYPMVTMNGEECHNEWEITFEEIHRNGAIAFAIYNYVRYFGDEDYLAEYGLEVLLGVSRFWAQRFNLSEAKKKYVMLGVTGPNEYENNVNNNWYTNYIARWTLQYTCEVIEKVMDQNPDRFKEISIATTFNHNEENELWQKIISNVHFPKNEELGIFLQQDGFMDKELRKASELNPQERPINQHWSWDRILRSCFIKQADVLQGMYLFEDHFSKDEIERNYNFYEPKTVHESSLSPCVHVVTAAYLDKMKEAYDLYLRTSRLDLDDYNTEVSEGLHITSMAGTWMSIVEGFAGMRVRENQLRFNPKLPKSWNKLSFNINFRGAGLQFEFKNKGFKVSNTGQIATSVMVKDELYSIPAISTFEISYK